ncbi:universal stress protein [Futiania mangrovi]|uniref:Universal stress protein n=1 Tax=Futiania mangrovi TaxID=2959716 RepID=A0A9J6PHR7_9PROT|nr:universal stress protein [Futiania mangrovii]MCP1337360.1 universal stress protein [Futiania mangrovii]
MPFKNLIHVIDPDTAAGSAAAYAAGLARAHQAHLTGLVIELEPGMPVHASASVAVAAGLTEVDMRLWEQMQEREKERAEKAAEAFKGAVDSADLSVEVRRHVATGGDMPDVVAVNARHADVSILPAPRDRDDFLGREVIEETLFSSGRPVIVVPEGSSAAADAKTVVIGWDGGREAARAVNDAMPILEKAQTVYVVTIDAQATRDGVGADPGADISTHLARHGVKVTLEHRESSGLSIGEALAEAAKGLGADIVVMGGYGHSRMRQMILGGTTRTLLDMPPLPVFLSH